MESLNGLVKPGKVTTHFDSNCSLDTGGCDFQLIQIQDLIAGFADLAYELRKTLHFAPMEDFYGKFECTHH